MQEETEAPRPVTSRATVVLATVATIALLIWLLSGVLDVLLLCFAGVLLGLFLNGVGSWLARRSGLPTGPLVITFALALVAMASVTTWLAAPTVASQVDDLTATLPRAIQEAVKPLEGVGWGRSVIERVRDPFDFISDGAIWSQAGGVISTTLGGFGAALVVLSIGLFTGYDPHLYRRGILRLFPRKRRARLDEVLLTTAHTLQMWLVGKLISMSVVGVGTWLGLAILGIPLALLLTLVAALLTFIPNFGPVLSAIPAILLGMLQGPTQALWVAGLYIGLQTVESFIFSPLLQKKMVKLPPALTIVAQVAMGALAGGVGVIVATPLTAAGLVLVKELYVKDVLGDS